MDNKIIERFSCCQISSHGEINRQGEGLACTGKTAEENHDLLTRILAVPVITDKIYQQITNADLLKCSSLSKRWSISAREFLQRSRRPCPIVISQKHGTPELDNLIDLLDNRYPHCPYNGIQLICSPTSKFVQEIEEPFSKDSEELEDDELVMLEYENNLKVLKFLMKEIYKRIPMKHVEVNFDDGFADDTIHKILFESLPLQEMQHFATNMEWHEFLKYLPNLHIEFTNLKSVHFRNYFISRTIVVYVRHESKRECLLKLFLNNCPALTEWRNTVISYEVRAFKEANKLGLVKSVKLCYYDQKPEIVDIVCKMDQLVLYSLEVPHYRIHEMLHFQYPTIDFEEYVQSVAHILKLNVQTLQVFITNPDILDLLSQEKGIPPLTKVKRVEVHFFRKWICKKEEIEWMFPNAKIINRFLPCLFGDWLLPICKSRSDARTE